ncbi:PilZ domain-containing protein [Bradyrhizobium japonicum]
MIERRAMKRIPINRAARLSFGEIHGTHPCLVRDINALGARISTPYYIFADEFVLSFDGHSGIFYCRVVWKKGTLCGVSFSCVVARQKQRTIPARPRMWCDLIAGSCAAARSSARTCRPDCSRAPRCHRIGPVTSGTGSMRRSVSAVSPLSSGASVWG